jgi:hypothetical protein
MLFGSTHPAGWVPERAVLVWAGYFAVFVLSAPDAVVFFWAGLFLGCSPLVHDRVTDLG